MAIHRFETRDANRFVLADQFADAAIDVLLWPDGSLVLTPTGEQKDDLFRESVMLTPAQATALYQYFQRERVRNRMLDTIRRLLHRDPESRPLLREIEKIIRQDKRAKAQQRA